MNHHKMAASILMALVIIGMLVIGILFIAIPQAQRDHNAVNKYGTKILVHSDEYGMKTKVLVVDDCEYIQYDETMIHKTNCKNPDCPETK